MIIKKNIKANFWIRTLATLIDLLIFIFITISTSFLVFNYKKGDFHTENTVYKEIIYRFWLLFLIVFLVFWYILIPIISRGQTVGMLICKIKILPTEKNDKKLSKVIFDRQRLFSFLWMFVFISFMLLSTDAFLKAARGNKLNNVEKLILSIPTALSVIAINIQLFILITGIKANRINLNDKFSNSLTVWKNKYEEIINEEDNKKIMPKKRVLPEVNLIE
ncbi:RDD family protein [Metamycoplasma gateae]|uniref:RDD family protein n=1 Tax=Metamycoplasma gateae TaxID=35769 RepID=A0ABZ2AKL3_9BACT|nr:RDD family protein [Metamycoplasma gateae]